MKWYEKQKENFKKKVESGDIEDKETTEDYIVEACDDHNTTFSDIIDNSLRESLETPIDMNYLNIDVQDECMMDVEEVSETESKTILTSTIAKGTKIEGNIVSDDNLIFEGEIKGQIACTQKIVLNGQVIGDLQCTSAYLKASSIEGNITAQNDVEITEGSIVNGFVHASSLNCAGKITGDVNISGTVVLESSGEIQGNVLASAFEIKKGAKIKGNVSID